MRPHPCDAFLIFYGMDKTSMSNSTKNRLNKKGFTLAEVLVTVVIILILAGVTFVSVAQYQKNLRLMEMDGTAKEIFIAAQNHLSVAKASGDLDRLAEDAKESGSTPASSIGTKLEPAPSYADNASGEYYYVIHNVTSGSESYTPSGSDAILQMMLPFGALDETVATGGNYAIVYELKSASVVAVLYSGAGNASFGNAAVIPFDDGDVKNIEEKKLYQDKSARKSYEKNGVTAIVGCYTGTAGSAAIPTETLEAPKLEVKNENKLHVIVSDKGEKYIVTLIIRGEQSGTVAKRILQRSTSDGNNGTGTFDVTLDDITGDGSYRFANIISSDRFTKTEGNAFIPGENIEISARVSSKTGLATPKESAKYTVSSLFGDANETKDAAGNTTVCIRNLRHLENLGANVSGFTAALGTGTTSGSSKMVNITAEQKNDITMFSMSTSGTPSGNHFENLYGSKIYRMEQEATFAAIDVNYPLVYHGNQHEIHDVSIGAQTGYTAAGIFGQVADPASGAANASLSVRDLILRNDRVSGTNVQNAGMLVGETTKDLTVDGVLAYYHEDDYNETRDSSVEVTASENAGGLIGLVAGGKLDVKNSAAAVYVKGGSAAGGFIGSVTGAANGSIVQSYAGGHTKDGAYSTTDATTNRPVLTGAGRYNVQASGYAGGFIGESSDKVNMNAVYSTASAYSNDATKSGSFSGNTKAIFGTGNNYYAIGPHNGTEASADDIAKAEITTGQVRRQATPYDRKLTLKGSETEHQKMDKTSYPLCTVRNLCEGDTSVKDTDLPWFIKEHVGDWVVHKEHGKAGFEIENGNRLTVRINTGLASITQPLLYKIKVHGESSNQDIYFNVEVKPDNTVTVKREYSNWGLFDISEIAECVTLDGTQAVQFYLDDITRENGHFYTVCAGLLCPGEDITVNVAPAEKSVVNNSVIYRADFKNENQLRTNSLFGYLEKSEKGVTDEHNSQKIKAVKTYYPNAGDENGLGLIPVRDEHGNECYYVQIDNSRHLENLSSPVAYKSKTDICNKITGAIQTDNIYWKGWDKNNTKDTFTEGFIEELGQNHTVNVYDDKGENKLATSNHFSPISYSMNLKMYDGSGCKISGLEAVEQNGYAAVFTQLVSDVTIKNLVLENTSFESNSQYTAGLIAYANAAVNIDNVRFTKNLNIKGRQAAAGFVAHAANSITINNSSIENGNINSTSTQAGGLVANAGQAATISNVKCIGNLNVSGYSETGGFVGRAENSITVTDSDIENGKISSTNGDAAGIVSYAGQSATIDKVNCTGALVINGQNKAAGFAAQAANSITITNSGIENGNVSSTDGDAAGLISYAGQSATIKKVNCTGRLIIIGKKQAAGFVAQAANGITITDSGIEEGTVYSSESNAGGLIGYAAGDSDLSNITLGNKDSNKEDLNSEFHVQSNGKNKQEASAGGLIARAGGVPTISNVHFNVNLTVENTNNSIPNADEEAVGGLIGFANAKVYIKDTSIKNGTVKSIKTRAGGFIGAANNEVEIKNSKINCGIISSDTDRAGGLLAFANQVATVDGVNCNSLIVTGKSTSGGFLGFSQQKVTIQNSELNNCTVLSTNDHAGGLIAQGSNVTISNVNITGNISVTAKMAAGGFVGYNTDNTISVLNSSIHSAVVSSAETYSGGFIGYTNALATISGAGLISDSLITSKIQDAGGVIGHATNNVNITNTKVVGTNTEIIAGSGNAGGLIGGFENRVLTINNSAASVFVRAENGSAGGLIGFINGLAEGSKIQNSYYGGRTIKGVYGSITVHKGDSANERMYAANIIAGSAAGGLIGAIEGQDWKKKSSIERCYSTGSVQTKNGPAGGFIGNANLQGRICLDINQCYSIGPVLNSDKAVAPIKGGFIGRLSIQANDDVGFTDSYYLNSFNADTLNTIGSSNISLLTIARVIKSPELITGQDTSANLTAKNATYVFDETLKGKEPYPYQNWTTENGNIAYYGDWPVPQIDGTLVYYHRDDGDKKKGICTLISRETSFQSLLTTQDGEVEQFGFGIILDSLPQDWDYVSGLYIWSDRKEGPFTTDKKHQMRVTKKYLTFYYGGKNYTFARVTNDELPKEHFYVKNMTTEDVYEVTYDEKTAEVKVVSEANG